MLDSSAANLEIPFASFCNTGSIPIRIRGHHAVMFPSKGRDDLPQGFVDTCQEKQGKAGEQSGADVVPPESKCRGSRKYPDGWDRVVNPVGGRIRNRGLLGLLNEGGNPLLYLGRQRANPTLDVGG